MAEQIELIEVRWIFDAELDRWVLVATEPAPRGVKGDVADHWMADPTEETT